MSYIDGIEIGRGGFSSVVECYRSADGEPFARKVLISTNAEDVQRFRREVSILESLDHTHIIKVIDSSIQDAPYWYVMSRYAATLGERLTEYVTNHDRIMPVYMRVLDAVDHAHSRGVIHRDLNPRNILLNSDADLVVTDFGLGRRIGSSSTVISSPGRGMGTSGYIAPEQYADAHSADERADIFSLGKLLNEMYTGTLFPSQSSLPHGLSVIVGRATNPDRERRFRSIPELREAISRVMDFSMRHGARERLEAALQHREFDPAAISQLVLSCENDAQILHRLATRLPQNVFRAIYDLRPEAATLIVDLFIDHADTTNWRFEYIDVIGETCRNLHDATEDVHLRAKLTAEALKAGVHYNRFDVMDLAAALISAQRSESEIVALIAELEPLAALLPAVEDRVNLGRLHPSLRGLFALGTA